MIRHDHSQRTQTVSDRELGIAALMLLLVMVLTVVVVPGLI